MELFGSPLPQSGDLVAGEKRFFENVKTLHDALLPWLRLKLQTTFVAESLGDAMDVERSIIQRLLENALASADSQQPGTALEYFLGLVDEKGVPTDLFLEADPPKPPTLMVNRVFNAAAYVNGFSMTDAELELFTEGGLEPNDPSPLVLNLNELPIDGIVPASSQLPAQLFEVWHALRGFYQLRAALPRSEKTLIDYLRESDAKKQAMLLLEATGWEDKPVSGLKAQGIPGTSTGVAGLLALHRAVELLQRVGTEAERLVAWAKTPAHRSHAEDRATEVVATVKTRYERSRWLEVARGLNDPLREKQRDALVAVLIPHLDTPAFPIETANDLLEYFLIDVEMSSCMLTSRIKQANSSIQLFVQRCLLDLEPGVSPGEIAGDQWEWIKNYRVWEANRKVFLYPENWIEPELRDDKTPFFKELETELLQSELTEASVETALVNYLYKLDDVARLDIRGFCKQEQNGQEKYHVFGRTPNAPYVYFYRLGTFAESSASGDWSPWERVELDIPGYHLVPLLANGRLFVLWPLLDEKPDPLAKKKEDEPPETRWEITLAWSEYKQGQWGPPRRSRDAVPTEKLATNSNTPLDEFRLRLTTDKDGEIHALRKLQTGYSEKENSGNHTFANAGYFSFHICGNSVEGKVSNKPSVVLRGPAISFVEGQFYRVPMNSLRANGGSSEPILKKIQLDLTPFHVLGASQDTRLDASLPFFFRDDSGMTYLARSIVFSAQHPLPPLAKGTSIHVELHVAAWDELAEFGRGPVLEWTLTATPPPQPIAP